MYLAVAYDCVCAEQCVLRPMLLRRTKDLVDEDGKAIVTLPPRHVHIVEVALSPGERAFYQALYSRSKLQFDGACVCTALPYCIVLRYCTALYYATDFDGVCVCKRGSGKAAPVRSDRSCTAFVE
jgi:SNF2 family DNA or RNA helicase